VRETRSQERPVRVEVGRLSLPFSNPANYVYSRHNTKLVDLSVTYRLTGLPAGAQLTLVQASRSPTVITVALQLPAFENHRRITHKFPSTTSLWEVLRVMETTEKLNLTERASPSVQTGSGRLYYEMPNIFLMSRELGTFGDLQKTLSQLGVNSGNVLLRLGFKDSNLPLEEAMQQISQYFKSEAAPVPATEDIIPQPTTQASPETPLASPPVDVMMADVNTSQPENQPDQTRNQASIATSPSPKAPVPPAESAVIGEASSSVATPSNPASPSVTVFTLPQSNTPAAAQQAFNENDYVPTIEHAKAHQASLASRTRNQRLLSDAELAKKELEVKQRQESVTSVKVRVRTPDQHIIQTDFARDACSGKDVYDRVRSQLTDKHARLPFVIKYVDNKGAHVSLPDSDSYDIVTQAGWRGQTLVNMVWEDSVPVEQRKGPVLKAEALKAAQVLSVSAVDGAADEKEEKEGFFSGLIKKASEKKVLGSAEKEAKLKSFLGFKKK